MLTEDKPGMIVYEDDFQVVAKSKKYWNENQTHLWSPFALCSVLAIVLYGHECEVDL
jgi:hypothetical protein